MIKTFKHQFFLRTFQIILMEAFILRNFFMAALTQEMLRLLKIKGSGYSQVQDHDFEIPEALNDEGLEPSAPVKSEEQKSVPPGVLWLQGKQAEVDASQMVLEAVNKKRRLNLARQPWQTKPSHLQQSYNMLFKGLPDLGVHETLANTIGRDVLPEPSDRVPWTVTRRLAKLRVPKTDADIRDSALRRLKTLVLLDPEATALGSSLVDQGKAAADEDIMQSLSDAFRGKASLTLQKRSLSLQSFVVRSYDASLDSPWRLGEGQIYSLFSDIRDGGSKASTASHILEALRWSDSQNIISLHLTAEGEGQLLIAEALGSKTSTTAEAKTRPYVCVAAGVSNTPWAYHWLQAREREGLGFDWGCLPSWSQKWGCWSQERMSSEEAADILLEVLTSLEMPPGPDESIGTHSFKTKTTLITWSGWSSAVTFSPKERLLMGHHLRKGGASSTLIYSRQYYINLAGKLLAMFRTIRRGDFDPDSEVSDRVAAIATAFAEEGPSRGHQPRQVEEHQEGAADVESSESAESAVPYAPMPRAGNIIRYRDFEEDDADDPDTCHQCRRQEGHVRLADRFEGQLQKPIGAEKPMDSALRELSESHDTNQRPFGVSGARPRGHVRGSLKGSVIAECKPLFPDISSVRSHGFTTQRPICMLILGTILDLSSPVTFNAYQYAHQTGAPPLATSAWVYELFAGTARFSKIDLTSSAAQKIFWDIMALGFLEGPFTEKEVSGFFHTEDWNCIRRFLILQGAEKKPRPIDDGHEALINNCCTSTIKLELQSSDFVTCMAKTLARCESERSKLNSTSFRRWLGKCLDLSNSKAYKQLPTKKEHRSLAVVYHKSESGEDQFFVTNSLMFGLTSAVYAFVRTSRSIQKLLSKLFMLPSSVYFDDYPMYATEGTAEQTDLIISEFLDILGWAHAKTGTKAQPFNDVFSVLGMQIDLSRMADGSIVLSNKPGRVERIIDRLSSVASEGRLTGHEAQVLLGLLNFSSGFFAGRALKQSCKWLSGYLSGDRPTSAVIKQMCNHAIQVLQNTPPRFIDCGPSDEAPVLVWTDGSWEPSTGFAGIGAVVLDSKGGAASVYEGVVPDLLLKRWRDEVGDQVICEIELYALLMLRVGLQNILSGRKVIFFIDNDAARSGVIRGQSKSQAMHRLALALAAVESTSPCISWTERVPSASNIADLPSRKEGWKAQRIVRAASVSPFFEDLSLLKAYLL
ncbi:unnamed protein product, partial [Symbiodinium necroappetens]